MKRRDFSPIAEQGKLELDAGLFSRLRRRRDIAAATPGFRRILLDGDSTPVEEVTAGQKYWSRARGWVKVDVRSHTLHYEVPFSDPSGLAGFVAQADVSVSVSDPAGAVAAGAESVEEFIRPALQNAIRRAHDGSGADPSGGDPVAVLNDLRVAADRNLEEVIGPLAGIPDWLEATVSSVAVELDDATEAHRKELVSKRHEADVADADGRSEAAKARNELLVRKIWEEGLATHLADPERRALARLAADPSAANIDRVAGQFDQIEAQGRAAIIEALREAINKGYFAEDDAIYNAIGALEKQYGNPHQALGTGATAKMVGTASDGDEHVVEAETVEAEAQGAPAEDGESDEESAGAEPDPEAGEEDRSDSDCDD